jgi:RNA polymerase sigma-70 factor (ECF subfamily)
VSDHGIPEYPLRRRLSEPGIPGPNPLLDLRTDDLHALQRGDVRALETVFRLFGDRVHRTCRNLLGQPADADDAAQEVFLRVLDKARTFAGGSLFSTWLYRLTVNHCLNVRKRRRLPAHPDCDGVAGPSPSPAEEAVRADARAELDRWLARLSPPARAVLVLREIEQLGYDEIAAVLGIPVGTVMSRLARARERLAALARPFAPETSPGPSAHPSPSPT